MAKILRGVSVVACMFAMFASGYIVRQKVDILEMAANDSIVKVDILRNDASRPVFGVMKGDETFMVAVPLRDGFYHYSAFVKVINCEGRPSARDVFEAWSVNENPPEGGDSDMCVACKYPKFKSGFED